MNKTTFNAIISLDDANRNRFVVRKRVKLTQHESWEYSTTDIKSEATAIALPSTHMGASVKAYAIAKQAGANATISRFGELVITTGFNWQKM